MRPGIAVGGGMRPGIAVGGGMGFLILLLVVWCLGGDPLALLQTTSQAPESRTAPAPAAEDEAAQFVSAILATTEDAWGAIFSENGVTYPAPTLVLFTDMVRSACGTSSSPPAPSTVRSTRRSISISASSATWPGWGGRRLRGRLCDRPRGGPPRSDRGRDRRRGALASAAPT